MAIFVNEYGIQFEFGTGFNLAGYTALSLAFTKPDGTVLTKTNPAVTVGNVDLVTAIGTFLANTYALYTFVNGDLNLAGVWHARLTYTDANRQLFSKSGRFVICALD